jgi:anti-anti-sigma factor
MRAPGVGWFATLALQRSPSPLHEVYGEPVTNGEASSDRASLGGAAFGCDVVRLADRREIRLEGEIDLAARPALDEALEFALDGDGVGDVYLDLDAVTFADSVTIAWLLSTDRRIRTRGGRLTIVACSDAVRELLRLTGIAGRIAMLDRGSTP